MSQRARYNYSVTARAAQAAQQAAAAALRRAEAERRAAEWAARSAAMTREHLGRYQSILDDIAEQGLDAYVLSEFAAISRMIAEAKQLTYTDPAAAKNLSLAIGPRIGPLPRTARQQRGMERAAQLLQANEANQSSAGRRGATTSVVRAPTEASMEFGGVTQHEDPLERAWGESLGEWTDHLARDLAFGDLAALRRAIGGAEGPTTPEEVATLLRTLRNRAEAEAEGVRRQEAETRAVQQQISDDLLPELDAVEGQAEASEAGALTDPEEARREAVRGVMNALEDAGFVVDSPRLVQLAAGGNEVIVVGTRASGASATFNLTLDGKLQYDFSGYRGASCDADIDTVVPALQDIYGIQLSDETVSWRNPDDQDAAARPQPGRTRNA